MRTLRQPSDWSSYMAAAKIDVWTGFGRSTWFATRPGANPRSCFTSLRGQAQLRLPWSHDRDSVILHVVRWLKFESTGILAKTKSPLALLEPLGRAQVLLWRKVVCIKSVPHLHMAQNTRGVCKERDAGPWIFGTRRRVSRT